MNLKPVHRKLFGQRVYLTVVKKKTLLKQNTLFTLKEKFNGKLNKDAKLSKFVFLDDMLPCI